MSHAAVVLASVLALVSLSACSSNDVAGGATGGGGSSTTGSGGARSTGGTTIGETSTDGGPSPASCAACTTGERCDVLNACYLPPQPSYCVPCDQHPICGGDGHVYDSDCAAIAAGSPPSGAVTCAPPSGRYACGAFFCDAAAEDCQRWSPVAEWPEPEYRCVPCAQSSGRACGDDGNVYADACALLQAGHRRGAACPGFIACGDDVCDTSVATCVMGFVDDCEGGAPTFRCKPVADAGP